MDTDKNLTFYSNNYINLASAKLGAKAIYSSDGPHSTVERLLLPEEPVFLEDEWDDYGKWMDGWETPRKREDGHDFCIIRLAKPGIISAIDLYTRFYIGNYPPSISIEACCTNEDPGADTEWTEVVPMSLCHGDQHNLYETSNHKTWTHIRINMYPDGGIARVQVFGEVINDWSTTSPSEMFDLAAALNGGRPLDCSDEWPDKRYGSKTNINMPGRGVNMGDGWETRRKRVPGFDWLILKLGHAGTIRKIEIDTAHFKGNYPHKVSINAAYLPNDRDINLAARSIWWEEILPQQPLEMDKQHFFEEEIIDIGTITHVRINLHPDGGISRARFFGHIDKN